MKKNIASLFGIVLFILFVNINSYAQNDSAAQKATMDYMSPGTMHQLLAKGAGEWTAKVKLWNTPGSEPIISESSVKGEMILGGRYLQEKHTGDFMGMPYEGLSITAYDNGKKVFLASLFDNFGTGIMNMEGKYDEAVKTFTFTGKTYDPTKNADVSFKQTIKYLSENKKIMEMYIINNGQEFKMMEYEMTKVK